MGRKADLVGAQQVSGPANGEREGGWRSPAQQPASRSESFLLQALGAVQSRQERCSLVELFLQEQAGEALQMPASQLDPAQPLTSQGLDSLSATELKNRLERDLGVGPPIAGLLEGATLRGLAERIAAQLEGGGGPQSVSPEAAGDPEGFFSLSEGQKALWVIHQFAPQSAAYNIMGALRLVSPIEEAVLRRSLQRLLERHPLLRSSFSIRRGLAVQRIEPQRPLDFTTLDASGWSEPELGQRLAEEAHRPFDLERDPLLRCFLLQRSSEPSLLLLALHHIVADFWSLQILLQELGQLCSDRGADASLPSLPLHYADFVRWQSELLSAAEARRLSSFWQRRLKGPLPSLDLPCDRPRPPLQSFRGGSYGFELEGRLAAGLEGLGRSCGATSFMVLLALFQTLLHRWTGQEDILTGVPCNGRSRAEFSSLVGYFVNPLVLRADFSGRPAFESFLPQVRQSCLQAFEHQDYPFARLVERLQPRRDPARSPIFQAMFVLQAAPGQDQEGFGALALGQDGPCLRLGGLKLEPLALEQRAAQFDLRLMMAWVDGSLRASLQYDSALFDRSTIARMAVHFRNLAEGALARPQVPAALLPLLSEPERSQVTLQWNGQRTACPGGGLYRVFAQKARQRSDSTAISCSQRRIWISYGAFQRQAARLADYLRRQGVVRGSVVGLCMESGIDLMAGLVGCLQAGGAYLPLDPSHPPQRLAFMLADAQAKAFLTHSAMALPEDMGPPTTRLDSQWSEICRSSPPERMPDAAAHPQDLAYIIYTSGSTGQPKGVAVAQRSVMRLVCNTDYVRILSCDCLSQASNIAFDVSAFEIWGAFLHGARLELVPSRTKLSPRRLADFLLRAQPSIVNLTPALFRQVVQAGPKAFRAVRDLLLAGEALDPSPVAQVLQKGPPRRLLNVYGPTENATFSTWFQVDDLPADASSIPIGRPIANSLAYVVDGWMQPLPLGLAGQLVLGGDGVARGYFARPALTADRFMPDSVSGHPGARLYRSGDLARWSREGQIEFLGRLDHQVKIRGFRIELGEIECLLNDHPSLREAVVCLQRDGAGNSRLTAYLVPVSSPMPPVGDLRRYLKQSLPEYMVPALFVELDALPLSPNGKVDRKALPEPSLQRPRLQQELVLPRNRAESELAEIWSDLLGVDPVGVEDNFFELGGDSILSIQAVARANQAGLRLTAGQAIQHQTIAELAAAASAGPVAKASGKAADERSFAPGEFPLARVQPDELKRLSPPQRTLQDLYPLAPLQQGLLFHSLYQPGRGEYVVQVHCRLEGPLNQDALQRAWKGAVQRHAALRTFFVWEGIEEPHQAVQASLPLSWQELDWTEAPADQQQLRREAKLRQERRQGFDPARPPLTRFFLARLGRQSHWLLWAFHHLILDGWSASLILQQVFADYQALLSGGPADLPPARPFRDYVAWLGEQSFGEAEDFWRRNLQGWSVSTPLPFDRPAAASGGAQQRPGGFVETAGWLDEEISLALSEAARRNRLTLSSLVQGAWALLLSRLSGEREVLFGLTAAGRPADLPGVESMAGLFINTLPLRLECPAERPLLDWLQDLHKRQQLLRRYEYASLAQIQKWSGVPSGQPLFESILIFENYPRGPLLEESRSGGLQLSGLRSLEWTHYPLNLTVLPGRRLGLEISWNGERFDEPSARRLLNHLKILLQGMAEELQRPLGSLPVMGQAQRHQLLLEWNDTDCSRPPEPCVHQLVEAQAALRPEAVAVEFGERFLSYAELMRRSERLASHLVGRGAAPEVIVAVSVQRGLEMVVAFLGCLMSGAAYLPLDPDYPLRRLDLMLQDAGAELLILQQHLQERLPQGPARLFLERDWPQVESAPAVAKPPVDPSNNSHLLYTSGSTGTPKGVVIQHRALVNFLRSANQVYGLGPGQRLLQMGSISFDAATEEIYCALSSGGTLAVRGDGMESTEAMLGQCRDLQLTALDLTTAYWHQVTADIEAQQLTLPACLQVVVISGERALPERLVSWQAQVGRGPRLLNVYGFTEAPVIAAAFEASSARLEGEAEVAIGRPIPNLRIYLLDRSLQPVPLGVAGEIVAGSPELTRGYFRRPAMTAQRYIPDPFSGVPGARLYRTGDTARCRPDGNMEYVGRLDHQVKLRGFRIESGEIEAHLQRHPQVHEAVVALRQGQPGGKRLVAYVVARGQEAEAHDLQTELRRHLEKRLPGYMVPAFFVFMESLPLTPSGSKVDRRALPAPQPAQSSSPAQALEPRTPAEERLAEIWRQVLGVEQLGVNDNFFELGGDSILSIQVTARASQAGLRLTPKQLFDHPTIAELARLAETVEEVPEQQSPQGLVEGELPLTPIQRWFFEQGFAEPQHWNQAVLLEASKPQWTAQRLEAALQALLLHHDALRLRYALKDGRLKQFNSAAERLSFLCLDLAALSHKSRNQSMESAAGQLQASLDLEQGPLFRAACFETGSEKPRRLLLAAHHLTVDGVSWRILLEDLQTACRQLVGGEEISLPPKTTSFRDWARRLPEFVSSGALSDQQGYWRHQSEARSAQLPVDFRGAGNLQADEEKKESSLSRQETQALVQDAPQAYGTRIDDLLVAALDLTLRGWLTDRPLRIELEGHGREDLLAGVDLSRTVGWFTSLFPVLLDLDPQAGPAERIKQIKEKLRAIPGRGIGYGLLRYCTDGEPALPGGDAAQISFNYLGQFDQVLSQGSSLQLSQLPCGPYRSPRASRSYLIEIDARILDGCLQTQWRYSGSLYRSSTIEGLAEQYLRNLRELIEHCLSRAERGYTPSDFPQMDFDQEELDELVSDFAAASQDDL